MRLRQLDLTVECGIESFCGLDLTQGLQLLIQASVRMHTLLVLWQLASWHLAEVVLLAWGISGMEGEGNKYIPLGAADCLA